MVSYLDSYDHDFKVGDIVVVNRKNIGNFDSCYYDGLLKVTRVYSGDNDKRIDIKVIDHNNPNFIGSVLIFVDADFCVPISEAIVKDNYNWYEANNKKQPVIIKSTFVFKY